MVTVAAAFRIWVRKDVLPPYGESSYFLTERYSKCFTSHLPFHAHTCLHTNGAHRECLCWERCRMLPLNAFIHPALHKALPASCFDVSWHILLRGSCTFSRSTFHDCTAPFSSNDFLWPHLLSGWWPWLFCGQLSTSQQSPPGLWRWWEAVNHFYMVWLVFLLKHTHQPLR